MFHPRASWIAANGGVHACMCCLLVVCFVNQSVPVLLPCSLKHALIFLQCFAAYQRTKKRVGKPVQTHLQCTCAHSHTDTHTYAYTLGALVFQDFSYSFSFILPFASTQFTQHGIISWWCQLSSMFAFHVRSAMIDVSFCEMPCLLNHHCEILTTSS